MAAYENVNGRTDRTAAAGLSPAARLRRVGGFLVLGLAAVPLFGCATKRDVTLLREQMVAVQARQDSLFDAARQRERSMMDSIARQTELLMRIRGELGQQLVTMEQHLIQIQELTGQSQRRLAELREELDSRARLLDPFGQPVADPAGTSPPPEVGSAEELYSVGMEQLRRGAAGTARRAFQQLLELHPTDDRAPDAQFQLAEAYAVEGELEDAYREFDRVVERYPESPRAPAALYRAAVLAEDAADYGKAREYLQRVSSGYPRSDEARLARDKLPRLPRR